MWYDEKMRLTKLRRNDGMKSETCETRVLRVSMNVDLRLMNDAGIAVPAF